MDYGEANDDFQLFIPMRIDVSLTRLANAS